MENLQITNYSIKNSIGQGGMATVYLAEDIKFQTNVALKVLNKEYVHNDNIRKRFIAEARNMFKMSHPNIIKVTDLIDEGDNVAFVMEYIEGETLKEFVDRKGKLSDEEIKTIFAQMLEAVGYVHEQNLVHRDIKPSNFMITPKGQIKLLDFGIAKNTDTQSSDYTQTGTSQNMGTPMYMSPEQIKSTKDVTLQSDIYSLGVVLWQMVMSKKPYDSNTLSSPEIQVSILKEPLPITKSNWDTIIQKATAKDVLNRYETCLEIKKALSKISELEEKTILSNAAEKTIVESSIIFEKEAEVRKSKTLVESTESSKHHSKKTTNIKKYWLLFLVIIPILLFSIYKYPFKSEENPPEEITLPTEVPQDTTLGDIPEQNKKYDYGDFLFYNKTSNAIKLAICYPIFSPNDWHSIGWINIAPGESAHYHSICGSPELYYYAYSENKEFSGKNEEYAFAINKAEGNFEYHLPQNPKNYQKAKFVDLVYFDRNEWPYKIVFK